MFLGCPQRKVGPELCNGDVERKNKSAFCFHPTEANLLKNWRHFSVKNADNMEKSAWTYNMEPKEQEAILDTRTDKGCLARPQPYWQRVGRQWVPGCQSLLALPMRFIHFKVACTEAMMLLELPTTPTHTSPKWDTSPGKKTWMASLLNHYIFFNLVNKLIGILSLILSQFYWNYPLLHRTKS